jgi:hypothetical protein
MQAQAWFEIIGYIASILIAISLMMSSILRLRIINLIGSAFFSVYGLLIHAYPVAAVNFFIVLIDIYYLYQMLSTKEYFTLLEVRPDSAYLLRFLAFYEKDIQKFLPGFRYDPQRAGLVLFVLRNLVPAGVVIGQLRPDARLLVDLDFVIPGYRDFKAGDYIFRRHSETFLERGIREVYSRAGNPAHESYLRRMGFQPGGELEGEACYSLKLQGV